MKHYICTGGCDTESDKKGVCVVEGCPNEDQALKGCLCEDSSHDMLEKNEDEEGEEEEEEEDDEVEFS